jgi:hypothetical protein
MKKVLLLMIVLVFVLSAAAPNLRLSRFTVINKSGGPIAMRLAPTTSESQMQYYLNIRSGDKDFPETAVFTVQENKYKVNVYFYKETVNELGAIVSEPICNILAYPNMEYKAPTVDLTRNQKFVVLPCNQIAEPKSFGEPGFWKYWFPEYVTLNYIY